MPILHAPILDQAGFVKSALVPVKNYVYMLDGLTKYYQLSQSIQVSVGCRVEITLSKVNDYFKIFDSTANRFDVTQFNGEITPRNDADIYVDGSLGNLTPAINTEYKIEFYRTVENTDQNIKEISFIGARFNGVELLNGYVKNFRVYNEFGVLTNEIPITNKAQGATQLPTIGSVSATIVGYNENDWEEV